MAETTGCACGGFEVVEVRLGRRGYEIHIGGGLLPRLVEHLPRRSWSRAAVVTDSSVGPLYAAVAGDALRGAGIEVVMIALPAGEGSKTAARALEIVDVMIRSGFTRSDVVMAVGGGVVGDVAGFAASVFKRGMDLVQVPTTLMAQVDSSIGGKTAVNLPEAKNMVGTFHQPSAVVIDTGVLKSLPRREFVSGLAEVAKYSVLTGREWGARFRADPAALLDDATGKRACLVAMCAREKAALVELDERDTGVRHFLNYGHTLGHALESLHGYGESLTHGEGVAIGMVYAATVSEELGVARQGLVRRHKELLTALGLPVAPAHPAFPFEEVAEKMAQDKKNAGSPVMVLLEEEGTPLIRRDIGRDVLERCYDMILEPS